MELMDVEVDRVGHREKNVGPDLANCAQSVPLSRSMRSRQAWGAAVACLLGPWLGVLVRSMPQGPY